MSSMALHKNIYVQRNRLWLFNPNSRSNQSSLKEVTEIVMVVLVDRERNIHQNHFNFMLWFHSDWINSLSVLTLPWWSCPTNDPKGPLPWCEKQYPTQIFSHSTTFWQWCRTKCWSTLEVSMWDMQETSYIKSARHAVRWMPNLVSWQPTTYFLSSKAHIGRITALRRRY